LDLRGRIDLFGVANLFQMLHHAEVTGKLVLDSGELRGRVFWHQGRLIYARTDHPAERLGDLLVRTQVLDPARLEGARIQAERRGVRIGTVLVEGGAISEQQLVEAIKTQITEVVYRLVALEMGTFSFYSQIYPENEDILLDVSLDLLLLEGLRLIDELQRPDGPPPGEDVG
jgi:hypothetical protein